MIDLKLATSFGSGQVAAGVVHRLLVDGTYRRHLDGLRAQLADAMSETVRRLAQAGLEIWTRPRAGMFLWARLPDGLDAARVARHALADNMILAPGNVFSASQTAAAFMRFNVAQCRDPKLMPTLQRAIGR